MSKGDKLPARRKDSEMSTISIKALATEFQLQEHEVAASLDLGRDYTGSTEVDEVEAREVLTVMAAQRADLD